LWNGNTHSAKPVTVPTIEFNSTAKHGGSKNNAEIAEECFCALFLATLFLDVEFYSMKELPKL
jgi:hypothetical protein